MPPRFQRPYPPEFRREAVRLLETSGRSIPQVAAEVGVSGESMRLWRRQEQLDRGEREDGLTSDEQEELRKLRRQVRELEAEREILKRAVTFFVRETDRR
ncbi:MAG TPA: transposase [Gaiella sp.]|jgi:transposase|nr:transposase [Gaiella sp.]